MPGKSLFTIQLDEIVAPKSVLLDQAYHLSSLADGAVRAVVETTKGNEGQADCFVHAFFLVVPELQYRSKLFEITHPIDVYPVSVRNDDWSIEAECDHNDDLEAAIGEILNSPRTKTRLEALRSQALAEGAAKTSPTQESRATVAPSETVPRPAAPVAAATPAAEDSPPPETPAESLVLSSPEEESIGPWELVPFSDENLPGVPEATGAAVIYAVVPGRPKEDGGENEPIFMIYSKNVRKSLRKQLTGKGSSFVKGKLSSGVRFAFNKVENLSEAEEEIVGVIGRLRFRRFYGDDSTCDWL